MKTDKLLVCAAVLSYSVPSVFCTEKQGEQEVTYKELFNGLIVNNIIDENAPKSRKAEGVFLNPFGQNLLCYTWIDAESPEAKLESMQDLIDTYWYMGWFDPNTDRDNKRQLVADLRTLKEFIPQMKEKAKITSEATPEQVEQLLAKLNLGESFVNEHLAQKEQELASLEKEWALSDFYGTRAQALNDFQPMSAFQQDLINFLCGKETDLDGGYEDESLQVKTFREIKSVDQLKDEIRKITRYHERQVYTEQHERNDYSEQLNDYDVVLKLVNTTELEPWQVFIQREDQLEKKPWKELKYDDIVDICVRVLLEERKNAADAADEIRRRRKQEATLPGGIKNPFGRNKAVGMAWLASKLKQ